jgi:hypothetical protein
MNINLQQCTNSVTQTSVQHLMMLSQALKLGESLKLDIVSALPENACKDDD